MLCRAVWRGRPQGRTPRRTNRPLRAAIAPHVWDDPNAWFAACWPAACGDDFGPMMLQAAWERNFDILADHHRILS